MRSETVDRPSFPAAAENEILTGAAGLRWQVLCGDRDHWRMGIYSPGKSRRDQIEELERHDCPEIFLLLRGRLTLVLVEAGQVRELALAPEQPALITAPHAGYCPDGAHTGAALVIERDAFTTEYRTVGEWSEL